MKLFTQGESKKTKKNLEGADSRPTINVFGGGQGGKAGGHRALLGVGAADPCPPSSGDPGQDPRRLRGSALGGWDRMGGYKL